MPFQSKPSNYNLRSLGENSASGEDPVPEKIGENPGAQVPANGDILNNTVVNMTTSVFRLESFKGDGTQNVEKYLKRFDQYKTCTGQNDEQAFATLAWHLDGTARLWFEHLPTQPNSLADLKTALETKFKETEEMNMQVYTLKQKVGKSVNNFLRRLEAETFKTKISDSIQVQIALNGMDKTIASAISTHSPKDLDEVKRLTSRMAAIQQPEPVVAGASAAASGTIPTRLETTVEVLTAAVAKLAATMEGKEATSESCPRCGGKCFSSVNCRAMGKICYKCNKPNHFGNKCRTNKPLYNVERMGTNLGPLDNASSKGIGPRAPTKVSTRAPAMVSTRGTHNRDLRLSIGRIHSFQWMGTHWILRRTWNYPSKLAHTMYVKGLSKLHNLTLTQIVNSPTIVQLSIPLNVQIVQML